MRFQQNCFVILKKNYVNMTICKVNTGQNILPEPRSILKELKRLFLNLYKSSRPTMANTENQFLHENLKALDETKNNYVKV